MVADVAGVRVELGARRMVTIPSGAGLEARSALPWLSALTMTWVPPSCLRGWGWRRIAPITT